MLAEHETRRLHLTSWVEVVGLYHGSHTDNHYVYVQIGERVVAFPLSMPETSILLKELSTLPKHQKIGILKTDLIDRPLLIRLID